MVSEVIVKELNPKWNMKKAEINPTNESDWGLIEFNVWDHDTTSPDDFLGKLALLYPPFLNYFHQVVFMWQLGVFARREWVTINWWHH